MKINLMTLLLFVLGVLIVSILLGSKVFVVIALAACIAVMCFVVQIIRMHRMMNRGGDEDDAEGR